MSSLNKLKQNFDKVLIKYTENSCNVLLVKGLNVFKGVSKCHENDNFNRKLGRKIALGRAEHAYKVANGAKLVRKINTPVVNETGDILYIYSQIHKFDDITKLDE